MVSAVVSLSMQVVVASLLYTRKLCLCLVLLYACILCMQVSYVKANDAVVEVYEAAKSSPKVSKHLTIEAEDDLPSTPALGVSSRFGYSHRNRGERAALHSATGRYMSAGSSGPVQGRLHLVSLLLYRVDLSTHHLKIHRRRRFKKKIKICSSRSLSSSLSSVTEMPKLGAKNIF